MKFSEANYIFKNILKKIFKNSITPAGSYYRNEEEVGDLDLVLDYKKDLDWVIEQLDNSGIEYKKVRGGDKFLQIKILNYKIDFWQSSKENKKHMIIMRQMETGHRIGISNKFKKLGFSLSDYGLKNKFDNSIIYFSKLSDIDKLLSSLI